MSSTSNYKIIHLQWLLLTLPRTEHWPGYLQWLKEEKPRHRIGNGQVFWRSWKFCVFCSIIDYIYHQIICDTTGKISREVGEIEPWQCFSYFVSWMLESKFKSTLKVVVSRNGRTFLTPLEKIKKMTINTLNHYNSYSNSSKNNWNNI